MMLGWMVYATVVSALLAAAAWLAERSADTRRAAARLYWSLAIVASLVLPVAIASVSIQAPSLTGALQRAAPAASVPLREMTSGALAPAHWIAALPAPPSLDPVLTGAWAAASGAMVAGIVLHGVLIHRNTRRWETARVAGVTVLISEDVGPAIIGLLRPRIVLPRWVTTVPPATQALIIAHERTHLDADDARLLAIAILLIVCMPWNLPLWWQLRRLRFAIEVDCDARVLRGGGDVNHYGETLILVGERHSSRLAVVAAMSEPKSNLEQRLRKMLSKPKKFAWASGAALAGLSLVVAAGAAEVSPPNKDTAQAVAVSARTLDGYVGAYALGTNAVVTVSREGTQLSAQVTGQPKFPIYPKTRTDFVWKVTPASITFFPGPGGKAASAVLHQNGANLAMSRIDDVQAAQIDGTIKARVKSQTAAPGSEAAVRRFMASVMAGKPDYSQMEPALAAASRKQEPQAVAFVQGLGPVQSVSFSGVGPMGNDVYTIKHEHGLSRWVIGMGAGGKIAMLAVTPGP